MLWCLLLTCLPCTLLRRSTVFKQVVRANHRMRVAHAGLDQQDDRTEMVYVKCPV